MTVSYKFEVDWDGDGSWDHASTDITSDVMGARWSHGRASDVDYDSAGNLSLNLHNGTGKYNSGNAASSIYGLIKPNRKVRVIMSISGSDVTMFSGFLENITPTITQTPATSTAQLLAYGPIAQFTDTEFDVALQETIHTGDAVDILLDGAGWPAGDRSLDTGLTTIAKYWIDKSTGRLSAIREMQDMEFGRFREGKDGKLIFDSRNALFSAPHDTAQSTYGTGTLYFKSIQQIDSLSGIYNAFRARCRSMSITPEVALATITDIDLGLGGTPIYIAAGASTTIDATLPSGSYYQSVSSWNSCSVTANSAADGSGSNLTGDINVSGTGNGQTYHITFSNTGGTGAYLTRVVAYGYGVTYDNSLVVNADDSTSQAAHGLRIYPHPGKWFIDPNQAQSHGNHALALYKNQRTRLKFAIEAVRETVAGGKALSPEHAAEIQAREIGDRIHIESGAETGLYVDDDFIIDRIEHSVEPGGPHQMTVTCTQAPTAELAATGGAYTFKYQSQYDPGALSTADGGNPSGASGLSIQVEEGQMYFQFNRPTSNATSIWAVQVSLGTGSTHHGPYAAQRAAYPADVLDTGSIAVLSGQLVFSIASGTPNEWDGKVMLIHMSGDTWLDGNVISYDSGSTITLGQAFNRGGYFTYEIVEPFYTQNAHDYTFYYPADFEGSNQDTIWKTKKIPIEVGTWYAKAYCRNRFGMQESILTSSQTTVGHVRTGATIRTSSGTARVQIDPVNGLWSQTSGGTALMNFAVDGSGRVSSATSGQRSEYTTATGLRGYDGSSNLLVSINNSGGYGLKTGLSGARMEYDQTNGIMVYDSSGNLVSQWGPSSGINFGTAYSGNRITLDATNGIRAIDSGSNVNVQIKTDGNIYCASIYCFSDNNNYLKFNGSGVLSFWDSGGIIGLEIFLNTGAEAVHIHPNLNASADTDLVLSGAGTSGDGNVVIGARSGSYTIATFDYSFGLNLASGMVLKVNGNQVVGARQAAIANATDAASTMARLNDLLAACRSHGLIAT